MESSKAPPKGGKLALKSELYKQLREVNEDLEKIQDDNSKWELIKRKNGLLKLIDICVTRNKF